MFCVNFTNGGVPNNRVRFFAPFRTCTVIDPANLRNSQAALVVLPSSLPRSSLRHSTPPTCATCTQHFPFFLRVVRPRHSLHHLRELPPSGPHLSRSRLRHFAAPFDSADLRNSHATLPDLPPCRPPSAQPTSPQRTAAFGSPSASQSSASFPCAIRLYIRLHNRLVQLASKRVLPGLGVHYLLVDGG